MREPKAMVTFIATTSLKSSVKTFSKPCYLQPFYPYSQTLLFPQFDICYVHSQFFNQKKVSFLLSASLTPYQVTSFSKAPLPNYLVDIHLYLLNIFSSSYCALNFELYCLLLSLLSMILKEICGPGVIVNS